MIGGGGATWYYRSVISHSGSIMVRMIGLWTHARHAQGHNVFSPYELKGLIRTLLFVYKTKINISH